MNILEIGLLVIMILVLGLLFMPVLLKTWYFIYDKSNELLEKFSKKNRIQNENQV